MTTTAVALTESLSRAWSRTAKLLWRPFDAKPGSCSPSPSSSPPCPPTSGAGAGGRFRPGGTGAEPERSSKSAWERFVAGGVMLALLVLVGLTLLLILVIALLWVSSRAKFVFLDDVVHGRARIVEPWGRFRREGNSLFLFSLAFFFGVCLLVAIAVAIVASSIGLGVFLGGTR